MHSTIKVLMVVDHAVGISGPHRNVVSTLNALGQRTDVQISLLCERIDKTEPYIDAPNIKFHLGFQPHNLAALLTNISLLIQVAPGHDLVYIPTNLKSLLYAQLVRKSRKLIAGPNVTTLPWLSRNDSPGFIELRLMSDVWFEASNCRREHVVKYSGHHTVRCVHHAINADKFSPQHRDRSIWQQFNIPPEAVIILYVGNDTAPRKGVECLLDAIDIFNATIAPTEQYTFVFAGNLSVKNRRRIDQISNAYCLGFVDGERLPIVYASADISVVPSSWENFPFSVLEAMSSGLPVLASRVGGIPEQVIDGQSGILLDTATIGQKGSEHRVDAPQKLAQAIAYLGENPQLQRQLGIEARQRVLEYFSEARLGEDLTQLFRSSLHK